MRNIKPDPLFVGVFMGDFHDSHSCTARDENEKY
jgi:hypothetical protein